MARSSHFLVRTERVPCINWVQPRLGGGWGLACGYSWERAVAVYCLPICRLPREDQRCRENGIRRFSRESADSLLQSLQGDTFVLVRQAPNQRAAGQEGNVHSREG